MRVMIVTILIFPVESVGTDLLRPIRPDDSQLKSHIHPLKSVGNRNTHQEGEQEGYKHRCRADASHQ